MHTSHSIFLVKREVGHWFLRLGKFAGAEATHWGLRVGNKCYQLVPLEEHIELGHGDYKADDWTSETYLGETPLSDDEIKARADSAIAKMDRKYNVLENNCQHFVVILVEDISVATEAMAATFSQQVDNWQDEWITPLSERYKKIKIGWQQMGLLLKVVFHTHHRHHDDGKTKEIVPSTAQQPSNVESGSNHAQHQTQQQSFIPHPDQPPQVGFGPHLTSPDYSHSSNQPSNTTQGQPYPNHANQPTPVEPGPQYNQAVPDYAYASQPNFGGYFTQGQLYNNPPINQPPYVQPGPYHGQGVADYRRATLPAGDLSAYQMQMQMSQQMQLAQHIAHANQVLAFNATINQHHNFVGQNFYEAYHQPARHNTLPTYWQVPI